MGAAEIGIKRGKRPCRSSRSRPTASGSRTRNPAPRLDTCSSSPPRTNRLLTGDVEGKLAQGAISEENAGRLQRFLRVSGKIVVDVGPDLIDILLPGIGLATRAGSLVAGDVGWTAKLKQRGSRSGRQSGIESTARTGSPAMEQGRIFEQFTQVLIELSVQSPLVIVLDDLHWVDQSSVSLLFHLTRRIEHSRILLLGSYRSEDVAHILELNLGTHTAVRRVVQLSEHVPTLNEGDIVTYESSRRSLAAVKQQVIGVVLRIRQNEDSSVDFHDELELVEWQDFSRT